MPRTTLVHPDTKQGSARQVCVSTAIPDSSLAFRYYGCVCVCVWEEGGGGGCKQVAQPSPPSTGGGRVFIVHWSCSLKSKRSTGVGLDWWPVPPGTPEVIGGMSGAHLDQVFG